MGQGRRCSRPCNTSTSRKPSAPRPSTMKKRSEHSWRSENLGFRESSRQRRNRMEAPDDKYTERIRRAEGQLVHFLRTFETMQEELHLSRIAEAQTQLRAAVGDLFTVLPAELSTLSPPESWQDFHAKLSEAVVCFADAYAYFLSGAGPNFGQAFLSSRQAFCKGLYLLYEIRAELPALQQYWVLPAALPAL